MSSQCALNRLLEATLGGDQGALLASLRLKNQCFFSLAFCPLTSGASWSSCSALMLVREPSLDDGEPPKGCLLILLILLFSTEGYTASVIQRCHSPAKDHGHQQTPPAPPTPLTLTVGPTQPALHLSQKEPAAPRICSRSSNTKAAVDVVSVPL